MNGFKTWLEDLERQKTGPDATVDFRPQASGVRTPSGGGDRTEVPRPGEEQIYGTDFVSRVTRLLDPIDPHLLDRQTNGSVVANFSGSPSYAPPEEARKMKNVTFEHAADEVENFLKRCAEHFVWLEKPCLSLLKIWMKFRSMLHVRNEGVNPVLYQVNLLRLKDFEKHFPLVDKEMRACEDPEQHADMIKAWNAFYSAWGKLIPTLKHYLVTFEKNTTSR